MSITCIMSHFIEFERLLNTCQNLKTLILIVKTRDISDSTENIIENGKNIN
jgi:hypothetical protein